jgi:hypothetical protein
MRRAVSPVNFRTRLPVPFELNYLSLDYPLPQKKTLGVRIDYNYSEMSFDFPVHSEGPGAASDIRLLLLNYNQNGWISGRLSLARLLPRERVFL